MFIDNLTKVQEFYYERGGSLKMDYNFEYLSTIEG